MERKISFDLTEAAATHTIEINQAQRMALQINRASVANSGAPATVTLKGSIDGASFDGAALPGCFASSKTIPAGSGTYFWKMYETNGELLHSKYLQITIDPGSASAGTGSLYVLID